MNVPYLERYQMFTSLLNFIRKTCALCGRQFFSFREDPCWDELSSLNISFSFFPWAHWVYSDTLEIDIMKTCLYNFDPILVRLSLLTMTNPNQLCDVLLCVCYKMADETNLSSKLPVADRTREVWGRKLCWWCLSSGFPLCTFLLGFADSFCFVFTSSPFYEASPLCTILCNLFPWLCWYVEVFKGGFESVPLSLLLTTMGPFSYLKFSIEDFLWQKFITHSCNKACPT